MWHAPETVEQADRQLDAEQAIADRCAKEWGYAVARKMRDAYRVDFAFFKVSSGRAGLWLEAKRRFCEAATYPTLKISLHKLMAGRELARASGLPFLIAIEYDDGIRVWKDKQTLYPVVWWGRSDRNDPDDFEPAVEIPLDEFKPLAEEPPCKP